jgi:hypothetical protein
VMTYLMDPAMVEAICETFTAMGRPYSKSMPVNTYLGFQEQYFIMVETPKYEDEHLVKGYLDMVGVKYEVITVTGVPGMGKPDRPSEGKYAMITVRNMSKLATGTLIEQVRDFGLSHRVIEEMGGTLFTVDIFCDERADVVKVGMFCSSVGLEMGISYADKQSEDRVNSVMDAQAAEPLKPEIFELGPVHSILLYRAYYAEEARKSHAKEEWFSQTDRDIQNRELWRRKAIEAGVPEAQADRYIYSGEHDFQGAGY